MPKAKSPAARARKREQLYLTPVTDAAGGVLGWRFNPGPGLRQRGIKSRLLQHDDGRWMGWADAKAARDAAITGAPIIQLAPAPIERRTLNALWLRFAASPPMQGTAEDADDNLSANTARFYRSMIKPWLKSAGDELVIALDAETIRATYKAFKAKKGHSAAHGYLRALQGVMAHGKRLGWLANNPAAGLKESTPDGRLRLGAPAEIEAMMIAAETLEKPWVADAIVAALWTAQRQGDLFDCDLARQRREGFLLFARTHDDDTSQNKTGADVQVQIMPPLLARIGDRASGLLLPAPNTTDQRWNARAFNDDYRAVRTEAAKIVPSVRDLDFRDLRDSAITRLHLAGLDIASIALWSGHSIDSINRILKKHYLVATREAAAASAAKLEEWRKRAGVKW